MAGGSETPPTPSNRRLIGELLISSGANDGRVIAVADNTVLGRDAEADVVLQDPSGKLSRRHARIRLSDGMPVLEDLDSTNGTFLNGKRIAEPRPLSAGDRIEIGESTLEFTPAPDLGPAEEMQATRARRIERPTFAPAGSDGELRILGGPGAGATAPVRGGSATIGREPECDLQVLDSEVSRRHAKVTIRDGVATIDDLHSANGTYVNGERILETYTLAPGDRIEIGEATIELTSPVFEGAAVRPQPIQLTAVREVLTNVREVLTKSPVLTAATGTRKWWTLGVVLTTTFMLLLDVTIVSVAIPSISKALHPSFSSLQWIVDGYTITLTTVLLMAGSMADIFGRKRVLTIGLIIFTVASVLCGLAPNVTFLIFARGLQGVGGATMFACTLALIVQEFPAHERAIAFGAYGAVNGVSVALGPIVGGLLIEGFGWESIFYINVPIGIAAFFVLQRKVVNLPGPETKIDGPGLVTFSGFMFLAIFATIRGNDDGWTSPEILGFYAGSIGFLVGFVAIERRRKFPMFDLRLFNNPTFIGASVAAFTICFSCLALIFFLTTWFQSILGYSAVGTGARMLVFTGAALAVGPIAGIMTNTVSPRIVLALSLGLVSVGALTMTSVSASDSWTAILPGLVLAGVGLGLVGPTLASTAVGVVPSWRGGMASGMNSTMREAGTTAGIAVLGTLLYHQVTIHVNSGLAGSFAGATKPIANAIAAGGTSTMLARQQPALRPGLQHIARVSYTAGLQYVFLLASIVAAVGCVTAIVLVRKEHLREDAVAGH
jgi:EmrB/QacA subfamily drug resistance transporter